ncbi:MAG: hypothetical protein QXF28_05295 [Nitrososphaerota archaeon]
MHSFSSHSTNTSTEIEKVERPRRRSFFKVLEASPQAVKIVKGVEDATVNCRITMGSKESWNINTSVRSFDEMLRLLAQYSKLNIDLRLETNTVKSSTWIIGNIGKVLGEALRILTQEKSKTTGIRKLGYSQGLYGEAFAEVRILLTGKAGCWITRGPNVKFFGRVGEISEEALKSFFVEFAQAIGGTLHVDLIRGEDPYNLWYATFIAFGEALANAFTEDEWYKQQSIVEPTA